jgi:hypothetical protein
MCSVPTFAAVLNLYAPVEAVAASSLLPRSAAAHYVHVCCLGLLPSQDGSSGRSIAGRVVQ